MGNGKLHNVFLSVRVEVRSHGASFPNPIEMVSAVACVLEGVAFLELNFPHPRKQSQSLMVAQGHVPAQFVNQFVG
jgi:hypothetical protein